MLWLSRPPYLRRITAGLVLVAAIALDVAGTATVEHPFLANAVASGSPIEAGMIEYRAVPAGLLPAVTAVEGYAARSLDAGDPLTPSALAEVPPPPPDWWSIRTVLPTGAAIGNRVRMIATEPALDVVGVVSALPTPSVLGGESEGMVAVPPDAAQAVAAAAIASTLTVLLGR